MTQSTVFLWFKSKRVYDLKRRLEGDSTCLTGKQETSAEELCIAELKGATLVISGNRNITTVSVREGPLVVCNVCKLL